MWLRELLLHTRDSIRGFSEIDRDPQPALFRRQVYGANYRNASGTLWMEPVRRFLIVGRPIAYRLMGLDQRRAARTLARAIKDRIKQDKRPTVATQQSRTRSPLAA